MKIASLLFCIFAVFNQQSFASLEKYQKAQEEYRKEQVCKKRLNTLESIVKFVRITLLAGACTHTTYHAGYYSGYYDGVQRGQTTESNYLLNDLASAYNNKVAGHNMIGAIPSRGSLHWEMDRLAAYDLRDHYMRQYELEQLSKEKEKL